MKEYEDIASFLKSKKEDDSQQKFYLIRDFPGFADDEKALIPY